MVVTFCLLLALVIANAPATSKKVVQGGSCLKFEEPVCKKGEYIAVKSCPGDITTTCTTVTWRPPKAIQPVPSYEILQIATHPDYEPGDTFPVGITQLKYTWKVSVDSEDYTGSCAFNVTVLSAC